ncbi:DUF5107 domain-containing protein [Compostimonas suwonensis]|uniref:Tetratricopeptide repeat protein n=1 Tax=Compostimonas suwonensis TaxID=1048394 RepID=A0A2M9BWG2_9MICO|nr:DUF5107 domain-containing protein [Compostimonas suwonensis]PJJ62292.1 tetratricopeptide repeat protein [Compostimonas suwonensis]
MFDAEPRLEFPEIPSDQRLHGVAAWREPVEIASYSPGEPDRYPAYLETRVYQGSSGQVFPLPFFERIEPESHPHSWDAIHLENEYLRLMVLPELGGRIHVGYDKTTGTDFFYRNNVIKPALVGLAGPWISGGVEFNWPQHHRPGTYLPTDAVIEREDDGAVTVWCSDHDPFARMKGMHGIRIRPGSALIEARVRLFNRTEDVQTFLWWANVAASVNDDYQSFFPTDVHVVADHAKRAITTFPEATGSYYGVDYPARRSADRPDADRLDWYRNIPVPTSYMCLGSDDDFFGGYDHGKRAGFVHVADHHIAPGKKQWTWGNAPFGWAWDDNLTDGDGPYIELMAGVYTDNQPDFSYLAPGETKAFSQFWYPYQSIGIVHQATTEAAVRLDVEKLSDAGPAGTTVEFGVATTTRREGVRVRIESTTGETLVSETATIAPGSALHRIVQLPGEWARSSLRIVVEHDGEELLGWSYNDADAEAPLPEAATELPLPEQIESADELYLAGIHLAQYRHASRSPEPYWEELLRRDPHDSRANVALAARRYRSGDHEAAEALLRTAIARQTRRNPNPSDGEAHYRLGIVLTHLERFDEAYDALSKSLWNAAWRSPAHTALARLDARAGRWTPALAHARSALDSESQNLQARNIAAIALGRLGRAQEAEASIASTRAIDPLDWWSIDLAGDPLECGAQTMMDVALEYISVGLPHSALRVLDAAARQHRSAPSIGESNPAPLIHYYRSEAFLELGDEEGAAAALRAAQTVDATRCLPGRIADADLLARALARDGRDARAAALLGHWLYFQRRYEASVALLEASAALDPNDPVVWRGLAIAAFNVDDDPAAAARHYAKALALSPRDAKLRYEADQLAKRARVAPEERLDALADDLELVAERDDLTVEFAELLVVTERAHEARSLLRERRFQPWEGGEGRVLSIWEFAHAALAREAMAQRRPSEAADLLRSALDSPPSLGEARHPLANCSDLYLAYGDALHAAGDTANALSAWEAAAHSVGDFQTMASVPYSEMTYFSALALERLGDPDAAARLVDRLEQYITTLGETPATIDYFATSLPSMLLFREDLSLRQRVTVTVVEAQIALFRRDPGTARVLLDSAIADDPANILVPTLRDHLGARLLSAS